MNYIGPEQGCNNVTPGEIARVKLIRKSKQFLTAEDEQFLHSLWKDRDYLPARNLLVVKHLPLIGRIVKTFKGAPLNDIAPANDFEGWQQPLGIRYEMLSEAVCGPDTKTDLMREVWNPRGFLRAIETFDPDRGCRLATHAAHSVLDALRQWNVRHRRCGEVVETKHAPFTKHVLLSWVAYKGDDGEAVTFGDLLADEYDYSTAERVADDEIRAELLDATLDERERIIWKARHHGRRKPWRNEDERPVTFKVLSKQLGISSQAVQQRAAIAEKKLRDAAAIRPEGRGLIPKPDWWVYKRPQDRPLNLYTRRKYPCWVYSPEEIAAFVASRPDLQQERELRMAA